jgi:hypothetical protein
MLGVPENKLRMEISLTFLCDYVASLLCIVSVPIFIELGFYIWYFCCLFPGVSGNIFAVLCN